MGPIERADALLQRVPRAQWRTIRWRQGTTGWRRQPFVAVRCGRVTTEDQRQVGWRLGACATRGQPAERQCSWSHRPAAATVQAFAGDAPRRDAVAPCHEEATGELGWDQDWGQRWSGFGRHAVTGMLAYRFWVWLERRQRHSPRRRGRPRDPCSPAPGPTVAHIAGDPS